jgi:hypothetical protein
MQFSLKRSKRTNGMATDLSSWVVCQYEVYLMTMSSTDTNARCPPQKASKLRRYSQSQLNQSELCFRRKMCAVPENNSRRFRSHLSSVPLFFNPLSNISQWALNFGDSLVLYFSLEIRLDEKFDPTWQLTPISEPV